jgi:hypothetical protein
MSLPLFTIARSAFSLYQLNEATGVIGVPDVLAELGKIGLRMELNARRIDRSALDEMVSLAQESAPVDTGRLRVGIEGEETDAYFEFRASAYRVSSSGKDQEDYAHFVEFGTAPGQRGQSAAIDERADMFSGTRSSAFVTGRRQRRQYRGHPGTEAQPFFYPAVDEALARRGREMDDVIPDAAREGGWELE